MGSGCNPNSFSSNGALRPTPDTSVTYTGVALPALGICTGDTLAEVDAVILQKIIDYSNAVGISVPDIDLTQCDCFTAKIGCCGKDSCITLSCILQAYLDCICAMYTDVADLKVKVAAMYDGPYTTKCLSNVTSSSKLPAIVNELISEFCTLVTTVAALQAQVTALSTGLPATMGNFLLGAIAACGTGSDAVIKSGSGSTAKVTFNGFAPIGSILMYGGTLTGKFDVSGLGISTGPMCGWALCNSQNNTVDMRGYFPVGVNDGSSGSSAQNAEVDNAVNPGQAYAVKDHGGESKHQLVAAELPSTPVTVSGSHTHDITGVSMCKSTTPTSNNAWVLDLSTVVNGTCPPDAQSAPYNIPHTFSGKISTYTGNYSGTVNGGNGKHENRPPYRALYFIQRVS